MRFRDEKNRLFGVINPIDLIVLIAVVVAVLVAASLLLGGPKKLAGNSKLSTIEFQLVVPSVRGFSDEYLSEGDVVSRLGAGELGTVKSFSSAPSKSESMRPDGSVAVYDSSIYQDVTINVKAQGEVTSQGFIITGVPLRNNSEVSIGTPRFEGRNAVIKMMKAVD